MPVVVRDTVSGMGEDWVGDTGLQVAFEFLGADGCGAGRSARNMGTMSRVAPVIEALLSENWLVQMLVSTLVAAVVASFAARPMEKLREQWASAARRKYRRWMRRASLWFAPRSRFRVLLHRRGSPPPLSKQLLKSGQLDGTKRYQVLDEHADSGGAVDLGEVGQAWILADMSVVYADTAGAFSAREIIDKDDPYWLRSERSNYLIWHLDRGLAGFLGVDRRIGAKPIRSGCPGDV